MPKTSNRTLSQKEQCLDKGNPNHNARDGPTQPRAATDEEALILGIAASIASVRIEAAATSAAAERAAVDAGAYSADGLVLRLPNPNPNPNPIPPPNPNPNPNQVLRHLRKQYGAGKLAVRDLCLRIQPGARFGFL